LKEAPKTKQLQKDEEKDDAAMLLFQSHQRMSLLLFILSSV